MSTSTSTVPPAGDALIFVVAEAAIHFFLEGHQGVGGSTDRVSEKAGKVFFKASSSDVTYNPGFADTSTDVADAVEPDTTTTTITTTTAAADTSKDSHTVLAV